MGRPAHPHARLSRDDAFRARRRFPHHGDGSRASRRGAARRPVRIIEAIVTGIAFLDAGTVFRDLDAHKAHGLTTAASLLTIAPIGIAIALDRYVLAVGVTALALLVLRGMAHIERRFGSS